MPSRATSTEFQLHEKKRTTRHVVTFGSPTTFGPSDIRRRLIEHAIDPSALMDRLSEGLRQTESPFEAEVFSILTSRGFTVRPQWPVGAYRIDMVVEGNGMNRAGYLGDSLV